MRIEPHEVNNVRIAEIITDDVVLKTLEDGLDLLGNVYYQGYDRMILHQRNIAADFFDLKTRLAGEVLQKFAQYRMPLAIVGDFSRVTSKSLADFIYESNQGQHVNFVGTAAEAVARFSTIR